MNGPVRQPEAQERGAELFSAPEPEPAKRGVLLWAVAAAVLIAAVGGVAVVHRSPTAHVSPNTVLATDPYAAKIVFTQLAMSESESLSGGKSTFIDGHVRNAGGDTLTAVTMQVLIKNDVGLAPTVETLPLTLIRTHEPYVDTEPVSAAPLKAGDEMEFRLIIESMPANWNQQMPELRVVRVTKR